MVVSGPRGQRQQGFSGLGSWKGGFSKGSLGGCFQWRLFMVGLGDMIHVEQGTKDSECSAGQSRIVFQAV